MTPNPLVARLVKRARMAWHLALKSKHPDHAKTHRVSAHTFLDAAREIKRITTIDEWTLTGIDNVILVSVTGEEARRLYEVSALELGHGIQPERLVQQFVSDLTDSDRASGSDEYLMAREWLERTPMFHAARKARAQV